MQIIAKNEIEASIDPQTVISLIEEGFCKASQGLAVIPPFGSLQFTEPPGEVHIKYGYLKTGNYYVVKIASNFYDNPSQGLASCQGLMALFCKQSGKPVAILQDDGFLTEIRTAAAGAVAAKYLAPKRVDSIGIVGTGAQAFYQLSYLQHVTDCRHVIVWRRSHDKPEAFSQRFTGFQFTLTEDLSYLAQNSRLIVTTTPSRRPLIQACDIKPGTHITAVGADDIGKQELDPELFHKATRVVVDSRKQAFSYGDCQHVKGLENVYELGECVLHPELSRKDDQEITICDLTGVAIQDIQIASYVYEKLKDP